MKIDEHIRDAKSHGLSKAEIEGYLLKKGFSKSKIDEELNPKPLQFSNQKLEPMDKIKLLFNPTKFFEKVHEPSIISSFTIYVVIALIAAIATTGVSVIFSGLRMNFGNLFFFIPIFIMSVVGTFIYSAIVHITCKIMKGKGKFTDSYNVVTYSLIPAAIISIIPPLSILGIIYSIVLMTFGLSVNHNFSKGKAVVAALIPFILLFLIIILFIGLIIFSLEIF